jgi:phage/plasmid-like protein (TIGR03299 family)
MSHEVETMMYTDWEAPWHGLGVPVHEAPNSAEALKLAGLDWLVEQVPVFTANKMAGHTIVPGFQAVRRNTDGRIFTVRSENFQPFQNHEMFEFLDALVGTGDLKFDTAGALFGGRRVWALARTPKNIRIGGTDEIRQYICVVNGHDGHQALQAIATDERVVCRNTLNAALARNRKTNGVEVRIYHSSKLADHVAEARRVLGIVNVEFEIFRQAAEGLAAIDGLPYVDLLLKAMFPAPSGKDKAAATVYDRKRATIEGLIAGEDGSAWGLLNGLTAYVDHRVQRSKKDDAASRHMNSALMGADAEFKTRAAQSLLDMTGIYGNLMREREALMVRVEK